MPKKVTIKDFAIKSFIEQQYSRDEHHCDVEFIKKDNGLLIQWAISGSFQYFTLELEQDLSIKNLHSQVVENGYFSRHSDYEYEPSSEFFWSGRTPSSRENYSDLPTAEGTHALIGFANSIKLG